MQPELDLTPPTESHPWKEVRPTSIEQYKVGREQFKGRKAAVLVALAAWFNRRQMWPTSAELTQACVGLRGDGTAQLQYVRRAISDLQDAGVVEDAGARVCAVSGRRCETWKIIPVGR